MFSETKSFPVSNIRPSNAASAVVDDPFLVFESSVSQSDASWPFDWPSNQERGKGSVQSSVDDFDDFVKGGTKPNVDRVRAAANKPNAGSSSMGFGSANYVDDIFGGSASGSTQQSGARIPSSMSQVD